jgi:LysM repeat protein
MLFRAALIVLALPVFLGCSPVREAKVDEQRNPYFLEGKKRVATRDYKGAIEAFETALEANPRSPLAHFELGVLYEQHSDQREDDYVSALYHYNQVVRLRPQAYPADNARQRIASCKQELVRSQSMAPVYQQTIRELDRLKDENQQLRRQLEAVNAQAASRFVAPAALAASEASPPPARPQSEGTGIDTPVVVATRPQEQPKERNPAPPTNRSSAKTHTVRAGDTAFSIARNYRVRLDALLAANPSVDSRRLKIGQTISIPSP